MTEKIYEPIIEKYLPKIKEMRLLDDDFMSAAFDNNIEGTQLVLRTILGKNDLTVECVTLGETGCLRHGFCRKAV